MKRISTLLSLVSFVGVVVLFILYLAHNDKGAKRSTVPYSSDTTVVKEMSVRFAYVNTDTLLSDRFFLYKEMSDAYMKSQQKNLEELNRDATKLQKRVDDFQEKLQNNGFLTEQQAQNEYDRIMDEQQKLQDKQQDMSDKALIEQAEISSQIFGTVTEFLEEYNLDKNYDVVFATSIPGNILYAVDGYDITEEVLDGLNAIYGK